MDFAHWVAPIVGGVALETNYWFQLRERLDEDKYKRLLASAKYWAVVAAMVCVGAAVAYFWADSKAKVPTSFEMLVAGAAAPSLLKNAVTSFLAPKGTKLGTTATGSAKVKDYFLP